jgi:sugar phosphate isomerase/epimerase
VLSFPTITAVEVTGQRVLHPAEELVRAAAATGFRGVGIDWFSLRDAERRGVCSESLAESAAALGLTWTDMSALGVGADAARDERAAASMARRCSVLGIGVCGLVISVAPDDSVYDRIARFAGTFAAAGVRLALEFVPYTEVRTLDAARAVCDRVGRAQCGLLIDTLHLARSGGSAADIARLAPDEIAAVQIADAVAIAPADLPTESRETRLLPGDGALDIAGFAAALSGCGWTGVVSTEVLSAELRARPAAALAKACAVSARRYFPEPC